MNLKTKSSIYFLPGVLLLLLVGIVIYLLLNRNQTQSNSQASPSTQGSNSGSFNSRQFGINIRIDNINEAISELQALGIFIVPNGTLESWAPTVSTGLLHSLIV